MDSFVQSGYTDSMSARSAMMYLRALRERHGWSRAELERLTGLPQKQLYRWEQVGDKLPDAAELGTWAKAVRASFADLEVLFGEHTISEAAVRAMADDRWEDLQDPNNAGAQEALDLIGRFRGYPILFGRWLEYGERLLDAIDDSQ
jgi:transcriptional regulator with XRE-family HTH domain